MDELCISQKRNLWLWTAVSRYTGQILGYVIGDRGWDRVAELWAQLPRIYQRRLVYTDGYGAYAAFLAAWQHRPCLKGDGGTCTVEGVNTSLRHRCSFLVRRHCGPRNRKGSLPLRIDFAARSHNGACQDRWQRRLEKTTRRTT
jgi:insertion element IS1 protein InsB